MSDGVVVQLANGDVEVSFGADGAVSGASTLTTLNRLTKVTATGTIGMSALSESSGALTGLVSAQASGSAGILLKNSSGSSVLLLGAGPGLGATFYGQANTVAISDTSASGITTIQASTQDGVRLIGRAGGTGSYVASITPTTLSASRTATLPNADITIAGINLAQTWTAAQTISGVSLLGAGGSSPGSQGATAYEAAAGVIRSGTQLRTDGTGTASIQTAGGYQGAGNVVTSARFFTGSSGSGTGGNVSIVDDGGTTRWLFGVLGTAGARNFVLYDLAGSGARLTVDSATGALTTFAGITMAGALSGVTTITASGLCTTTGSGAFGASALLASERLRIAGGTMGTPGATDSIHADGSGYYGNTSATSLRSAGGIRSLSPTVGIGYSTGAGGTVSQATSRTTGVTLDKVSGAITLFSTAGSTTPQTFTVTCSACAATDTVIVNQKSGTDLYVLLVTNVAAGSFKITAYTTGGTTSEAPVITFNIIKGVTS